MTELIQKVQQKADLELQQQELQQEKKRLEKEVFDLKIAAHNEQVDVDAMEGFSVKGLLLKMTGKHEERLEEERREARTAKSKYDLAVARLASVNIQLEQIAQDLSALAGCEDLLSAKLTEALGKPPCQEEANLVHALASALSHGALVLETGKTLHDALDDILAWAGERPAFTGIPIPLARAKKAAQEQLVVYRAHLDALQAELESLGYALDTEPFRQFSQRYLLDFFTDTQLYHCCGNVQNALMQIGWQWKALLPQLDAHLRRARISWLNALVSKA